MEMCPLENHQSRLKLVVQQVRFAGLLKILLAFVKDRLDLRGACPFEKGFMHGIGATIEVELSNKPLDKRLSVRPVAPPLELSVPLPERFPICKALCGLCSVVPCCLHALFF